LLDSSVSNDAFEGVLRSDGSTLDLLIFDTTCFAGRSGRIRRVLGWARSCGLPVVMVRSHTKLDSLGAEYGRLGSAAFVTWSGEGHSIDERLAEEARNAVRLLGGAALPAHFPPYVGTAAYWTLTKRRVAAILRGSHDFSSPRCGAGLGRRYTWKLPFCDHYAFVQFDQNSLDGCQGRLSFRAR